jgi:hypothetical protein
MFNDQNRKPLTIPTVHYLLVYTNLVEIVEYKRVLYLVLTGARTVHVQSEMFETIMDCHLRSHFYHRAYILFLYVVRLYVPKSNFARALLFQPTDPSLRTATYFRTDCQIDSIWRSPGIHLLYSKRRSQPIGHMGNPDFDLAEILCPKWGGRIFRVHRIESQDWSGKP